MIFKDGKLIKNVSDARVNDELNIKLIDGEINTIVKGVNNGKA